MTHVAIIGGGIGGLTAANALSQAGIEVAVYEAAAELKEIGAGVALHPNAMKVLRAIGVEDNVPQSCGAVAVAGHAQLEDGPGDRQDEPTTAGSFVRHRGRDRA